MGAISGRLLHMLGEPYNYGVVCSRLEKESPNIDRGVKQAETHGLPNLI
jgi:hypothetical protein